MGRRRLDLEIVARGLASTREQAQRAIDQGRVLVRGSVALKPSTLVARADDLRLAGPPPRFVSRGGEKLDGALEDLGVGVEGIRCLDAGAGTGGFTDCLLQRGAARVTALDVGFGQIALKLREDPRVEVIERANLREADPQSIGAPFDLVVADLSFISLVKVAGVLARCAGERGSILALVKPQFEAGRGRVGRGGIVSDPAVWRQAIAGVAAALEEEGFGCAGVVASRLRGADGNQEFFLHARRDAGGDSAALAANAAEAAGR
jgi:23S rRNA (cytidine1920-2'-O)/16S rRNA (cytidine1409-2'-O)-methyltransferase